MIAEFARSLSATKCPHCQFGLIVTGHGEEEFLPQLFKNLTKFAGCSFKVLRKIGQRGPVGPKRQIQMTVNGKRIPSKDEELGLEVRNFLRNNSCHFVILIDDLEQSRVSQVAEVWSRYRESVDAFLTAEERSRFAVHFLANMLEAYYFADAKGVNSALGRIILEEDWPGDVESIPHPKGDLKSLVLHSGLKFDEKSDGSRIVPELDLLHILSRADTCGYLRSLFAWCVCRLQMHCPIWNAELDSYFCLQDGKKAKLTCDQKIESA